MSKILKWMNPERGEVVEISRATFNMLILAIMLIGIFQLVTLVALFFSISTVKSVEADLRTPPASHQSRVTPIQA